MILVLCNVHTHRYTNLISDLQNDFCVILYDIYFSPKKLITEVSDLNHFRQKLKSSGDKASCNTLKVTLFDFFSDRHY